MYFDAKVIVSDELIPTMLSVGLIQNLRVFWWLIHPETCAWDW